MSRYDHCCRCGSPWDGPICRSCSRARNPVSRNVYEKMLAKAEKDARAHWGLGWDNLAPDMQRAEVCRQVVGDIAAISFDEAFTPATELEHKLLSRLVDLSEICERALLG